MIVVLSGVRELITVMTAHWSSFLAVRCPCCSLRLLLFFSAVLLLILQLAATKDLVKIKIIVKS